MAGSMLKSDRKVKVGNNSTKASRHINRRVRLPAVVVRDVDTIREFGHGGDPYDACAMR